MRAFILALVLLGSFYSSSASAIWYFGTPGHTSSSTPLGACKLALGIGQVDWRRNPRIEPAVISPGTTNVSCFYEELYWGSWIERRLDISSDSASCVPPSEYDPNTGGCSEPVANVGSRCGDMDGTGYPRIINSSGECVQAVRADIAAFCKFHGQDEGYKDSTLTDVLVQKDPNGNPIQPTDTAQFGCSVKVTGANCTTPPPDETCADGVCVIKERSAVCTLNVHHTGEVFNNKADPGVLANARCVSGNCLPPPPKQQTKQEPCTYVSTGPNSVACVSSQFFTKEGQSQCGTVNGVLTCRNDMPKPVSGGIKISTDVKTETLPDGSTKTTKTDKRTDTKCVGMALVNCISGVTTSSTVTIKDGNGKVTSTTGSCTGKLCPDSNTNPDADGDGFGDCVGGDCTNLGGEGGEGAGVKHPELGEVPGFGEALTTFEDSVSNGPIPTALRGFRAPSGGQCPSGNVDVFFGHLDFSAHCELVQEQEPLIRLIAKLAWAFLAMMIFLG
ncbi:hypothetical protein R0G64_27795 [Pseudomonas otitidis]|uniref:Uncharacterized protein n=1 Tax=Metapseudomonas otitidis TaxID=319939 RepID=A0ABU3XZ83_9GAMM|nr:hypothetical protein [Pseudomonas otitidis]MDV3443221.1 hypothetical protein [Pseudomonas otitidis]